MDWLGKNYEPTLSGDIMLPAVRALAGTILSYVLVFLIGAGFAWILFGAPAPSSLLPFHL
jgi:hypothetical protein